MVLKQVENFTYLGWVFHATGACEEDVKARISAACEKWCELLGVLCDQRMPIAVKGKVYKTKRPVMIYGAEAGLLES